MSQILYYWRNGCHNKWDPQWLFRKPVGDETDNNFGKWPVKSQVWRHIAIFRHHWITAVCCLKPEASPVLSIFSKNLLWIGIYCITVSQSLKYWHILKISYVLLALLYSKFPLVILKVFGNVSLLPGYWFLSALTIIKISSLLTTQSHLPPMSPWTGSIKHGLCRNTWTCQSINSINLSLFHQVVGSKQPLVNKQSNSSS